MMDGTISRNKAFANELLKFDQLSHPKGVAYNLLGEKADSMDKAGILLTMNLLGSCKLEEMEDVLTPCRREVFSSM